MDGVSADDLDRVVGDAAAVRSVFDNLNVLVACYAGPELRAVAANAALRALTGQSEVIGKPYVELFPEMESQQVPDLLQRVRRTREVQVGREWRFQVGAAPGPVRDLFLDFVVTPHPEDDDAVICYAIDVSERVHQRDAERRKAVDAQRRYEAVRDVVDELQRALLPVGLPVLASLDIAARYLIAAHDQSAGGDWFDAITLPGGTVALVVGDVVGHGVTASASMGQIRAVLKQSLSSTDTLEAALAHVDRFACSEPPLKATTLAVMVIDPATGRAEYSLCGHPPIMVVSAGGSTAFLDHPASVPLGVGHRHSVSGTRLTPGDVVMLYSDGLVEHPGRPLAETTAQLAQVAANAVANRVLPVGAAASPAARACELTVELMTRGGYDDDVTALAAQFRAAPAPTLGAEVTCDAGGAAQVLATTARWLDALNVGHDAALAVELAVNEAVENAIEHAYLDTAPGLLRITGELHPDGVAEITVGDDGRWRHPVRDRLRNSRGLALVERLVDHVVVKTDATRHPLGHGTVMTVRHRLTRPALIAATGRPTASPSTAVYASEQHPDGGAVTLRVMGAVNAVNADRFAADVADAARGGTVDLTVDLSALTQLSSSGVRTLFEIADNLNAHQRRLTLVADPATPARVVIDLVGLAHAHPSG